MKTRLQLIRSSVLITLGVVLLRFVLEAAGLPGAPIFDPAYLVPVFAVTISIGGLRNGMGYRGFLGAFLLYTLMVRLAVVLMIFIGKTTGWGSVFFTYRNFAFGVVLPHTLFWPIVSFIVGTLIWPICALALQGRQARYRGAMAGGVAILIIIFIGLPYAISSLYTGGVGGRRAFKETPSSLGVPFEDIELKTADGLTLRGWYLPHEQGQGTVIYCHGLFNQRSELLDQAVFMHRNGFRGLLFDFRRHGQSDGAITTFGYYERQDVEAAVRYVTGQKGETGPVILWGISMGAANALLAGAQLPAVKGVIAESSFYSARETLRQDLGRMFRLPVFPFANLIEWMTERRLNIDLDALDLGKTVPKLGNRPVLLVGGTADVRMPIANNTRLYDAIPGAMKEQFVVEGAGHADAWRMATDAYKTRVLQFLKTYGLLNEV